MKRSSRANPFIGILVASIIILCGNAQNAWAIRPVEDAKGISSHDVNTGLSPVDDHVVPQQMPAGLSMSSAAPIDPVQTAITQVNSEYGNADIEFVLKLVDTDHLGYKHVRLNQFYKGIPVIGGEIIVHIDANNQVFARTGKAAKGLNISVTPGITAAESLTAAEEDLGFPVADLVTEGPDVVIFGGTLVYEFMVQQEDQPNNWHYFVNANTGEIVQSFNDIKHVAPNQGSGAAVSVGGNRLAGEDGSYVTMMGWQNTGGPYFLYSFANNWGVYDLVTYDWEQTATADWGMTDPAAVSCGYNLDIVQDYVATVLNFNSFNNAGAFARCNIHQGTNYVNAYWDSVDFHFGDGDGVEANSLAVLDIIGHEYGHAITQYTSNLVYSYESGALNESYSDILGTLIEYYAQPDGRTAYPSSTPGMADWLCGEDSWLSSEALRDLRDPQRYGQPSAYKGTDWYWGNGDNGGVHYNSGVQNFVFYLLAEGGAGTNDGYPYNVTGLGIQVAGEIAMYANMYLLTPTSEYWDARDAWVLAAGILGYDSATVDAVWDAAGFDGPRPMDIVTDILPEAIIGQPYSTTLVAAGGEPPYTWSIISGNLPTGITLDSVTGTLDGTPGDRGLFKFLVRASDSGTMIAEKSLSINVTDVHWIYEYMPGKSENAEDIAIDADGNIYITGSVDGNFLTVKYDPQWNLLWARTYGGSNNDGGHGIAVDGAGNVYVAGQYDYYSTIDCMILKYSTDGALLWARNYNGGSNDICRDVQVDAMGNIFVTGMTVSPGPNGSPITMKYNASGTRLWTKIQTREGWAYGLDVDSGGNVYITGAGNVNPECFTTKYDTNGNQLWDDGYASGGCWAAAADLNGNVFVTGRFNNDFLVIKYDTNGNRLWTDTYDAGGYDIAWGVDTDANGNAYVTGQAYQTTNNNYDYMTLKYDSEGSVVWERTFDRGGNDNGKGVAVDGLSGVYVTGTSSSGSHNDIVTVRYEQDYPLRVVTYSLSFGLTGQMYQDQIVGEGGVPQYTWSLVSGQLPEGLVLDPMTGAISGVPLTDGVFDFTVQLTDTVGASVTRVLSVYIYDVPEIVWVYGYGGNNIGNGRGVAVDADGNSYVTGDSFNSLTGYYEAVTMKLDAYGVVQWVQTYPSAYMYGIALDAMGNAYVTGYFNNGSNYDYVIIKYDTDGNQVWGNTYDGGGYDYGYGITVDENGYVYVTGISDLGAGRYYDVFTMKLDPEGQVVWSTRYDTGTRELGYAIAVDNNGNVYVSGAYYYWYNYGYSGNLVIKYDPEGNILWTDVYDGTFYMDRARGIAVDDVGNAYLAGAHYDTNTSKYKMMLLKYDSYGNVKWFKTPDRAYTSMLYGIQTTSNRDLLAVGYTYNGSNYDIITSRISSEGDIIWTKTYDSGSTDYGYALAQDGAGNITVAGSSYGTDRYLVLKYGWLPIKITSTTMSDGYVGTSYSGSIIAIGGDDPDTWTITAGNLPDGLVLDSGTGMVSGVPTVSGSFTFTAHVTDVNSATSEQVLTIDVYDPIVIDTTTVPHGVIDVPYNTTLAASGGKQPYSWLVTAGALPDGLSLDSATGEISGVPTLLGSFSFTVQAADVNLVTAEQSLTIDAYEPLMIETTTLPYGITGSAYNGAITGSGGLTPYAWSVVSGSLPDGVDLDGSTGVISGVPTVAGDFAFTVRVSDANGSSADQDLSISIYDPLVVVTTSLSPGITGSNYTGSVTVAGGLLPYRWSVTTGVLPDGLVLDGGTGEISGIPTITGSFEFTVQVTDANANTAEQVLAVSIYEPLVITTTSMPLGTTGLNYSGTISAAGGLSPYAWDLYTGNLPGGLSLDSATGVISGIPTQAGSYVFTIGVSDAMGNLAVMEYTIDIYDPLNIAASSLTPGTLGVAYSDTLSAEGGLAPYAWVVYAGNLPTGLSLDGGTGVISGIPTQPGSYVFSIGVSDAIDGFSVREFTINIYAPVAVATYGLYPGITGMNYTQVLGAMNGLAPYSWQITAGSLPYGLSLDSASGKIGGVPSVAGTYVFTVMVTDALNGTASRELKIDVYDLLVITTDALPGGIMGEDYSGTLTATGGLLPYSWTIVSGALPDGLTLDSASGEITGTLAAAGSFTFTVEARDSYAFVETRQFTIEIDQPDADGDGFWNDVDCNDNDASIYPGAPEIKRDGIDQDCNGYDLTIVITRAEYDDDDEELKVYAESDYGSSAALQVEGYGPMTWKSWRSRWVLSKDHVWHAPDTVTVTGPEGSVTANVDIDD